MPCVPFDGLDHPKYADLLSRLGERETAAISAFRLDESVAGKSVQDRGKVGLGDLGRRRDVFGERLNPTRPRQPGQRRDRITARS